MVTISKNGALVRLALTAVVAFFGAIFLSLQGQQHLSWSALLAPVLIAKGLVASAYTVERYMNTSWARAHSTGPVTSSELLATVEQTAAYLREPGLEQLQASVDPSRPLSPSTLVPTLFRALTPVGQFMASSYMASLVSDQHKTQATDTTTVLDSRELASQHESVSLADVKSADHEKESS